MNQQIYSFNCSLFRSARIHQRAISPVVRRRNAPTRPPGRMLLFCRQTCARNNSADGHCLFEPAIWCILILVGCDQCHVILVVLCTLCYLRQGWRDLPKAPLWRWRTQDPRWRANTIINWQFDFFSAMSLPQRFSSKHRKNCESCSTQVIWKVKF